MQMGFSGGGSQTGPTTPPRREHLSASPGDPGTNLKVTSANRTSNPSQEKPRDGAPCSGACQLGQLGHSAAQVRRARGVSSHTLSCLDSELQRLAAGCQGTHENFQNKTAGISE